MPQPNVSLLPSRQYHHSSKLFELTMGKLTKPTEVKQPPKNTKVSCRAMILGRSYTHCILPLSARWRSAHDERSVLERHSGPCWNECLMSTTVSICSSSCIARLDEYIAEQRANGMNAYAKSLISADLLIKHHRALQSSSTRSTGLLFDPICHYPSFPSLCVPVVCICECFFSFF